MPVYASGKNCAVTAWLNPSDSPRTPRQRQGYRGRRLELGPFGTPIQFHEITRIAENGVRSPHEPIESRADANGFDAKRATATLDFDRLPGVENLIEESRRCFLAAWRRSGACRKPVRRYDRVELYVRVSERPDSTGPNASAYFPPFAFHALCSSGMQLAQGR